MFTAFGLGHVGVWAHCAVTGGWADAATDQRAAGMQQRADKAARLRADKEDRRKRKQEYDDKKQQRCLFYSTDLHSILLKFRPLLPWSLSC